MDKESAIKSKKASLNSKGLTDAPDKFSGAKQYDHNTTEELDIKGVTSTGVDNQDRKASLVARVHTDSGYGFYDSQGRLALPIEYQLLKNDMYPYNGEFDFNFYLRKEGGTSRLFYIDINGAVDLGQVVDAIPLREDLVAVCRRGAFYGIIDKKGNNVLEANKFGRIIGISNNGYKVCEVEKDVFGLVDDKGKMVVLKQQFDEFIVNPLSDLLCGVRYKGNIINELFKINCVGNKKVDCNSVYIAGSESPISKVYVYGDTVVVEFFSKSGKRIKAVLMDVLGQYYYQKEVVNKTENWKGKYYIGQSKSYELSSPLRDLKAKFIEFKNHILVVSRKNSYMINCDFKRRFERVFVLCKNDCFVGAESRAIVLGIVKNTQIKYKRLKKYNGDFTIGMYEVISLGGFVVIHYWKQRENQKKLDHTIIVDSKGEIVKEDLFNQYKFLSGPIHDYYYYLENGEIVKMHGKETEGTRQSDGLQAEMMWPLGLTERFLIKKNNEYQIVDSCGTILRKPFNIVSGIDMDSICNSKYIPIVNAEGKFGRVDTDGKVIVPCEFSEIFDMK